MQPKVVHNNGYMHKKTGLLLTALPAEPIMSSSTCESLRAYSSRLDLQHVFLQPQQMVAACQPH